MFCRLHAKATGIESTLLKPKQFWSQNTGSTVISPLENDLDRDQVCGLAWLGAIAKEIKKYTVHNGHAALWRPLRQGS